VANISEAHDRFEVALVDVLGNGLDAGARALLPGDFGSLLGAMDPAGLFGARQLCYVETGTIGLPQRFTWRSS
jgi:hypothetical protein